MTIVINSPPTPGYFEISPEYGTELEDMFTFSLWSDDDLPITYQYGLPKSDCKSYHACAPAALKALPRCHRVTQGLIMR